MGSYSEDHQEPSPSVGSSQVKVSLQTKHYEFPSND